MSLCCPETSIASTDTNSCEKADFPVELELLQLNLLGRHIKIATTMKQFNYDLEKY